MIHQLGAHANNNPGKAKPLFAPVSSQSLPVELLAELFQYAPPRARLRAIGLVCKLWRTAALRATTSMSLHCTSKNGLASVFSLYSSLTDLTLSGDTRSRLPTSLRRLSLRRLWSMGRMLPARDLDWHIRFYTYIPILRNRTGN